MKLILHLLIAAPCIVSLLSARAQSPVLLTTFPNPTPEADDDFSGAVAALGNDCVLIGAPGEGTANTGAVYLFRTNGVLLRTFANPNPSYNYRLGPALDGDWFGSAIAAVGSDRVLIGAAYEGPYFAGQAYLFSTNGTLLTSISSPAGILPSDWFGTSVAVLGHDRLIVGAPDHAIDEETGVGYGVAYLFSTNGTLLATFENPNPDPQHLSFGYSLAPFGSDRVLIGSQYGPAYLFDTNGTLLMTFINPVAGGSAFANSLAAVGNDRVFVGSPNQEAAYVFNTNGTLLTTFANPTPANNDGFGARVAVLGSDRLVISCRYDDIGATNSGAAYVFSPSGTLLNTITNPTPAVSDGFSARVAALGNDRVIIGAMFDDTKQTQNVGTAYLFSIPPAPAPPPSLTIMRTMTNTVIVSWPSSSTNFVLQQNTNSLGPINWSNVTGTIQDNGINKFIIVNPSVGNRFYRLFKP
jgi:outer membrane protein assembly factor BamB